MSRQGRILVLDDLQKWREELVDILQEGGFYAKAVSSAAEALKEVEKTFYHVLLLDVRLNDADPTNQEGIDLLYELKKRGLSDAIKVVMISNYGDKEKTRKVFREYGVADFVFKDDFNDEKLLQVVRSVFSENVSANLALEIIWQDLSGPRQAVLNLEVGKGRVKDKTALQGRIASEFEDLLCRLFYPAKRIMVQPLAGGYSGSGVLRVQPFYTVDRTTGGGYEVVVKFGDGQRIEEEHTNFIKYVQPFLGGGRNTTAFGLRRTSHLGGIIYSLLGTLTNQQVVDFGEFYHHHDTSEIVKVLDSLFKDTCRVWYANRSSLEALNLTTDYQRLLTYEPTELDQIVADQLRDVEVGETLKFEQLRSERTFTNPWRAAHRQSLIRTTYRCITHGDFHQRNLLVDDSGWVWMIDFGYTGESHILRDVAMLDSAMRFQLLAPQEATLEDRLQMEEALCSIEDFSQLEEWKTRFVTENPALAKCCATVLHLRKWARRLVQHTTEDITEYSVALFYSALNTICFSLKPVQREHAILCASLLADRLKLANKGDTPWIPRSGN
jgi:CheY-like chemotaxis protein